MEKCFDKGELNKKDRHTTTSCQKMMLEKLGKHNILTETQIASYWSNYRKRKRENGEENKTKKTQKLNEQTFE